MGRLGLWWGRGSGGWGCFGGDQGGRGIRGIWCLPARSGGFILGQKGQQPLSLLVRRLARVCKPLLPQSFDLLIVQLAQEQPHCASQHRHPPPDFGMPLLEAVPDVVYQQPK